MANIYGKLKAVTADGVLADAEQIEETATGKSVAVALNDLRRAVQGQIDPSVINVDAYTKKETDGKIEALSQKLDGISSFKYSIVDELPLEGENGVIYLIGRNDGNEEENIYNEYIWLKDSSKFELLGTTEAKITVDKELSSTSENPVQNKAIYSELSNKADKNNVPQVVDSITAWEPNPVSGKAIYNYFGTYNYTRVGLDLNVFDVNYFDKTSWTDPNDASKNGYVYHNKVAFSSSLISLNIGRCQETDPKNVYIQLWDNVSINVDDREAFRGNFIITVALWEDYETYLYIPYVAGMYNFETYNKYAYTYSASTYYYNLNKLYPSHINKKGQKQIDTITIFVTGRSKGADYLNIAALSTIDNSVTYGTKSPVKAVETRHYTNYWDFGNLKASKPTTFAGVGSIKLYKAQYNDYLKEMEDTTFKYECIIVDKDKTFKVGDDITDLISDDFKRKNKDNFATANALNIIRLGDDNTVKTTGAFAYIDIDFNNGNKHIYKIFATVDRFNEKTGDTLAESNPYEDACTKYYYNGNIPSDADSSENANTYYLHIVKSSSLYVFDRSIDTYLPVAQEDDNEYPTTTDADTLTTSIFNVPTKS